MKKTVASIATVAVVGLAALTLTAARHHRDPEAFLTKRIDSMLDEVKATDAQRQQILAIRDKLLADGKALRAQHAGVRQQLLAQWQADQPDAKQVHALVDGRADAAKSFADEVADAVLKVHDILTPEQRAQVAARIQEHRGQHHP